ncbi:MAG: hypothetical protein AB1782_16790 [Cyanobacteriota bacterium]
MNLRTNLRNSNIEEFKDPGILNGVLTFVKGLISFDREDDKAVGLLKYKDNESIQPRANNPAFKTIASNSPLFNNNRQLNVPRRSRTPVFVDKSY